MNKQYKHLGSYSDLIAVAKRCSELSPLASPNKTTRKKLAEVLSFQPGPVKTRSVKVEKRWTKKGVDGELVSWSVGYGPRTEAYVLRPAGVKGPLPGIVALHDHGGFKYYGKEKIADGSGRTHAILQPFRDLCYDGLAYANELARAGYAVLVADVFLWGSRRTEDAVLKSAYHPELFPPIGKVSKVEAHNTMAIPYEDTIEKYCTLLNTTLAAIVNYEDRVSVDYFKNRKDVIADKIGCVGLSGGGMRSVLLQGQCDDISAAVIVGAMTTSAGTFDHNVVCHTWMLFPAGWAKHGGWSDIAACRAPSPVMVQNDIDDPLYTMDAMRAADKRMAGHYKKLKAPENYECKFYPGLHKFDAPMQADAIEFLNKHLKN